LHYESHIRRNIVMPGNITGIIFLVNSSTSVKLLWIFSLHSR